MWLYIPTVLYCIVSFLNSCHSTRQLTNLHCSLSNKRSAVYGDGAQYLSDLLDVIRNSSTDNAAALRKLQSGPGQISASPCSPEGDNDDSMARERRFVIMVSDHFFGLRWTCVAS